MYNVFGIQVGVGITIAIRSRKHTSSSLRIHTVDKTLRRREKLELLEKAVSLAGIDWNDVVPDVLHSWQLSGNEAEYGSLLPMCGKVLKGEKGRKADFIFKTYTLGVSTNRDSIVYDFHDEALTARVEEFCEFYNAEVDRLKRVAPVEDLDSGSGLSVC